MREHCLNLACPPNLEEGLLDALLETDGIDVFSTMPLHLYGVAASALSVADQVMGRSRATLIQALVDEAIMKALIDRIGQQFAGAGIRYWVTPVAFEGVLK